MSFRYFFIFIVFVTLHSAATPNQSVTPKSPTNETALQNLIYKILSGSYFPQFGPEFELSDALTLRDWDEKTLHLTAEEMLEFNKNYIPFHEKRMFQNFLITFVTYCQKNNLVYSITPSSEPRKILFEVAISPKLPNLIFSIYLDQAVLEFNFPKKDIKTLKLYQKHITQFIFKMAKKAGLIVDEYWHHGHFNIDLQSAFANCEKCLLSYMSDYMKFSELSLGVFGNEINSSLHPYMLPENKRMLLVGMFLEHTDYFNQDSETSIKPEYNQSILLAKKLYRFIFNQNDQAQYDNRNHLFNFKSSVESSRANARLEHRDQFGQRDIDDFILRAEIFVLRMKYLAKNNFPVLITDELFMGLAKDKQYTDQEKVDAFYEYITEADGDYHYFKRILRSHLQDVAPTPLKSRTPPLSYQLRKDQRSSQKKLHFLYSTQKLKTRIQCMSLFN